MVEILKILDTRPERNGKMVRWAQCRCSCGKIFESRLSNVKAGQIKSCGHDRINDLDHGRNIRHEYDIDGTNIVSLTTGTISKNNTTGYKGVARTRNGKYRAYITFKRKQYHLGTYDDPALASKAYEAARNELYGCFLEWYAQNHPDRWDKMNKK